MLRSTAKATACGPSCTAAAPSALEVCNGWRPWTRVWHCGALADGHAKGAHQRALHRQLFLILQRHPPRPDRVLTPRTLGRQRRVVDLVDVGRRPPVGAATIGRGRPSGRGAEASRCGCHARRGRPDATRRGAPPRALLSVSRFRDAAAAAPLPTAADPRAAARSQAQIVDDLLGIARVSRPIAIVTR